MPDLFLQQAQNAKTMIIYVFLIGSPSVMAVEVKISCAHVDEACLSL